MRELVLINVKLSSVYGPLIYEILVSVISFFVIVLVTPKMISPLISHGEVIPRLP